jgi:hypothetical protein
MVTINQNLSSDNGLVIGATRPLEFAVSTTVIGAEAVVTPGDPVGESNILASTQAGAWAKPFFSFELGTNYTLESLTPSTATISGNTLEVVGSGGHTRVKIARGAVATIYDCNTTTGSKTVTVFDSFVTGTAAKHLSDQILSRITGTEQLNFYTNWTGNDSSLALNPSCWAAGIDLSGVPVATTLKGRWGHENKGGLITSQHVVGARHWSGYTGGYVGMKFRFRATDGVIHERTVIGLSYGLFDTVFFTLNTPLPATVTPLKIMGEWFARDRTYANSNGVPVLTSYNGGVFFYVDQAYNCRLLLGAALTGYHTHYAADEITVNGNTYTENVWRAEFTANVVVNGHTPSIFTGKANYVREAISGDSGSPLMALVNGVPALVGTFFYPTVVPFLGESNGSVLNDFIIVTDAAAGVSTGLTVTVAPDPTAP